LCRLPSHRAACAGVPNAARAQPPGQGARPQRAGPMPGMWSKGASRGFDQVEAARRLSRCVLGMVWRLRLPGTRRRWVPGPRPGGNKPLGSRRLTTDHPNLLTAVPRSRGGGVGDGLTPGSAGPDDDAERHARSAISHACSPRAHHCSGSSNQVAGIVALRPKLARVTLPPQLLNGGGSWPSKWLANASPSRSLGNSTKTTTAFPS
jgi:hypothetical protein